MKYQLFIIALVILLPFLSSAEVTINNSGSIKSVTSSSASTGGNIAESGGTVVTGNSSASSKSEVTSGSGGTEVHIETSTTVNGQTSTQKVDKTLKGGEPVSVEVNSNAVSGQKAETSIKVNDEELGAEGVATVTQEVVVRTAPEKQNLMVSIAAKVSIVLKNIFSVFKFW